MDTGAEEPSPPILPDTKCGLEMPMLMRVLVMRFFGFFSCEPLPWEFLLVFCDDLCLKDPLDEKEDIEEVSESISIFLV